MRTFLVTAQRHAVWSHKIHETNNSKMHFNAVICSEFKLHSRRYMRTLCCSHTRIHILNSINEHVKSVWLWLCVDFKISLANKTASNKRRLRRTRITVQVEHITLLDSISCLFAALRLHAVKINLKKSIQLLSHRRRTAESAIRQKNKNTRVRTIKECINNCKHHFDIYMQTWVCMHIGEFWLLAGDMGQ